MLNIRSLTIIFVILGMTLTAFLAQAYIYLSDCSIGGVRDSAMIDDADKTSGCLPQAIRWPGLIFVPAFWGLCVWFLMRSLKRKRNKQ